jgi:hypothetical protein
VGAAACVPAEADPPSDTPQTHSPIRFDYVALDGRPVNSGNTRGRVTVVVYLTSYDLPSQIIMRELADLAHSHQPRFNALGIALEPPKNAPLVEAFASTLELPFPVALTRRQSLEEAEPFGRVLAVPTTIVLDKTGLERSRRQGTLTRADLEHAIVAAEH